MASQPLETIPEEPTPTPNPTPTRVTADPPTTKPAKNPGRVASGKRLAERNRLAREAKKKEQAASASNTTTTATTATASANDTNTDSDSGSSLSIGAMLGIGGLIVSLLGVYYQREAIMAKLKPAPPVQPTPAPTPAPSRIPVKQGIKKSLKPYSILPTMNVFCEGVVIGLVTTTTIPVMYAVNKVVLNTLFAFNVGIAKALICFVLLPPPEFACENSECPKCNNNNETETLSIPHNV